MDSKDVPVNVHQPLDPCREIVRISTLPPNRPSRILADDSSSLGGTCRSGYTPLDAVKSRYAETAKFHYGVLTSDNWSAAGHYTPMVWHNTTQIGIGQSPCKDGTTIIVAEYDPPGNYMGQAPY